MPGLFDSQGGPGLLGTLGQSWNNYLDRQMSPSQQEVQLRQFQQELFMNQLREQQASNPNISLGQALYNLQHPEIQYGMPQAAGNAKINGIEIPVYRGPRGDFSTPFGPISGGGGGNANINAPQPVGQTMAPQNAGGANGPIATPGQGGGVGPMQNSIQPLIDLSNRATEQEAAAKARGTAAGTAAAGFPSLLQQAHSLIGRLQSIRDNPHLPEVLGRMAGSLPAKYSANPDLVNDIDDANNALKGDLFRSLRSFSGRPTSAGAIKEMNISDLQGGRSSTPEGYRSNLDKLIQQIQDETNAAWVGANSPPDQKPVWGKNESPQQQPQAIPPVGGREVGKIYNTPKGPHKWLGNGWEPVGNAAL